MYIYIYIEIYIHVYIYIYIHNDTVLLFVCRRFVCCTCLCGGSRLLLAPHSTVSFHNFKSQNFKLSVSNPKSKYVAYLSVLSQISNCQSLGRKNKHEILKTDRIVICITISITTYYYYYYTLLLLYIATIVHYYYYTYYYY